MNGNDEIEQQEGRIPTEEQKINKVDSDVHRK